MDRAIFGTVGKSDETGREEIGSEPLTETADGNVKKGFVGQDSAAGGEEDEIDYDQSFKHLEVEDLEAITEKNVLNIRKQLAMDVYEAFDD